MSLLELIFFVFWWVTDLRWPLSNVLSDKVSMGGDSICECFLYLSSTITLPSFDRPLKRKGLV